MMHWLWRVLTICMVAIFSAGLGVRFNKLIVGEDVPWPYRVKRTVVYTPDVPPGRNFRYARDIDYFNDDCSIFYDRALLSLVPDEKGAFRRVKLDTLIFQRPPLFVGNKLQSQDIPIPSDFPCGPAVMIDSPYAYCTRYQRLFSDPMRRADALTNFNVTCQHADDAR